MTINKTLARKIKTALTNYNRPDEPISREVTYWLLNNRVATNKTPTQLDDIDILITYDNLLFNAEIIDYSCIDEYQPGILTQRETNKLKKNNNLFMIYQIITNDGKVKQIKALLNRDLIIAELH